MSLDFFLYEQRKMAERVKMTIEEHYHPDAIEQAYNIYYDYVRNLQALKYPINDGLFREVFKLYQHWRININGK